MTGRIGIARAARLIGLAIGVALAPPGRAEAGRVRGTVVDREGRPAAGARVWAARLEVASPLEVREATADELGAFVIGAGPGIWSVFALRGTEGGRAGWGSLARVEADKDPEPVAIRLGRPTTLKGRLIDAETGEPIAGGRFALDDARRLEVDARGRFEAPGLASTNHEAYPLCPGYERKRILFDTTGRPDAELELKLAKAGKVVGRVLDADGKPIPGARVGLSTSGTVFSGSALWEHCSEDGRYSYDGKPLGRAGRLSAYAPGYQDRERSDVVVLDPASPTEVNFTLAPDPRKAPAGGPAGGASGRRTVFGTVVGPGGRPVASALVRWDLQVGVDGVAETKTDERGAFHLEHVPDAANILSVIAKGLAPGFPPVDAGGDRRVEVELKAGATIRGRAVDEAGEPIEGIRVVPQVANPRANSDGFVPVFGLQGLTDRDGRFTLEGMPEGTTCDLVAQGWSATRGRALSPLDESKNVVTMVGGGMIRGRVVGPSGSPVKNFRIQVGIPKDAKPGEPVGGYFAGYGGTGLAFTRPDGEFTISGLTAGNLHRLTAIAEDLGAGEAERVEAHPSGRRVPGEPPTIRLGTPHAVRVRVFQSGGKLVEGARVTVIQSEGRGGFQWGFGESSWDDSVTARVNDRGWAEFPAQAFGRGVVVVRAKGFSRAKLEWAEGEEEINALLEPEASLAGTVLDEAGRPVEGARIRLTWGQGEMMDVPVDEKDGGYRADGLNSGRYFLNVLTDVGPRLHSESVELGAGKVLSHDIRVKRPGPGDQR